MDKTFDIVIIGAGIVGLTFACSMAETGLSLAIIDGKKLDVAWSADSIDLRVSAITRGSQQVLQNLNVWQTLPDSSVSSYRYMDVWDGCGNGSIQFDSADVGQADLGHIIENRIIIKALHDRLQQFSNVTWLCPLQLDKLQQEEKKHCLYTDKQNVINAALIVGADGAKSWLRQQAGFSLQQRDYQHHAIIAAIKTALPHGLTARQCFLAKGPLAFLPLQDPHLCSIVWSTAPEHANELMAQSAEVFNHTLADSFAQRLGACQLQSERVSIPLIMRHVKNYVKPGLALIGDAAHTIHPLAGQGVNLGILDAACLAQVLQEGLQQNAALGDFAVLRRYERWRKGHNAGMIGLMDGFKNLFSHELAPIAKLRNFGLNRVNRNMNIKRWLIKQAMGLDGDLPALATIRG